MVSIVTKLQPFQVPNYVLEVQKTTCRQEGFKQPQTHKLCDIPEKTLIALCDEFKENTLKKAKIK